MKLCISSIPIMLAYLSEPETASENMAPLSKIFAHEDYLPDLSDQRKSALRDKFTS